MCAMMPMLRTFLRSVSTSSATGVAPCRLACARGRRTAREEVVLPAVVSEGPVGLGHLVDVLATLHGGTEAVRGVEDLVHEALGHRLLTTHARVVGQPAQREGRRAHGADLDRHLVRGATDAARAHLERRTHVVERTLEDDDGVLLRLLAHALERAVDDGLRERLLAVDEDL